MTVRFHVRYEKALRRSAGSVTDAGRLRGAVDVVLAELDADPSAAPKKSGAPFELLGPGDVARLAEGAITRRFPAPGASDAEATKLALVEFAEKDLPWRYTPEINKANLRPWLVLVVGHRAPGELVLRPDGRVGIGTATQLAHPLAESWKWAHVHEVRGTPIARLLSPAPLKSENEYVACLVPAFTTEGGKAWSGASDVTVDCYDRWTFRTTLQGDFPDLAERLHRANLSAEADFGRAEVAYDRRDASGRVILATAGALRLPPDPGGAADPADAPPPAAVAAEVSALTERIVTPDGRGVVTAPAYERPHTEDTGASGWIGGLRGDPRARGAAGIGAWNAIEWQDRIADAAAAKAGDLAIAADRIRHAALGLEVTRSLWQRHLPAEQIERLAVLATALARLPVAAGSTVLRDITGRTPGLTGALLSSAARRALRPGSARTSLAAEGAGRFAAVLAAADTCPVPAADPADITEGGGDVQAAVDAVVRAATPNSALTDAILGAVHADLGAARLAAALRALAPGADPGAVDAFLADPAAYDGHEEERPSPGRWPYWIDEVAPPEPCAPIDLTALGAAVESAISPFTDPPPVTRRVLATLPGIPDLRPVEIDPELDLPLWSFLSTAAPDWMLPGAKDLAEDEVVAVATNPAFVQALLAGANHQAVNELRWRNIPLKPRVSPLRKFWQRPPGEYDIAPIRDWPTAEPLGATALSQGRLSEAVVVFRTSLFRRYPATVVYLYPMENAWAAPAPEKPFEKPDRKDPTFTGTIGEDLTFFGFPVEPAALLTHWVVLEEPPAGYRFYEAMQLPGADVDSGDYARNRFAWPVRVLIGELLTEGGGPP